MCVLVLSFVRYSCGLIGREQVTSIRGERTVLLLNLRRLLTLAFAFRTSHYGAQREGGSDIFFPKLKSTATHPSIISMRSCPRQCPWPHLTISSGPGVGAGHFSTISSTILLHWLLWRVFCFVWTLVKAENETHDP